MHLLSLGTYRFLLPGLTPSECHKRESSSSAPWSESLWSGSRRLCAPKSTSHRHASTCGTREPLYPSNPYSKYTGLRSALSYCWSSSHTFGKTSRLRALHSSSRACSSTDELPHCSNRRKLDCLQGTCYGSKSMCRTCSYPRPFQLCRSLRHYSFLGGLHSGLEEDSYSVQDAGISYLRTVAWMILVLDSFFCFCESLNLFDAIVLQLYASLGSKYSNPRCSSPPPAWSNL